MQVYPFTQGALYRLYAAPQKVSDIALQPGEALIAISAGDTVRWAVGDTTVAQGPPSKCIFWRNRSRQGSRPI
ncbi:MAG TPA: TrbG/VirB9 family P-type conjugative transfer protein [Devosia sp.]|nr:TrbG/VirB9 family P-type conjugative transfer protein [Devosia sp.]